MTIEEFIKLIKSSPQHQTLYHFTDEANFPSIKEHGLLSKEKLRQRDLWPPQAAGGNQLSWDLDLARGIDPCVSLCMTRNHPMVFRAQQEGRLAKARYLAIKPEVLRIVGTRIALGIANSNDAEILSVADAVDGIDVDVLYTHTDWNEPAIKVRLHKVEKYEVLVPDAVPLELITGF